MKKTFLILLTCALLLPLPSCKKDNTSTKELLTLLGISGSSAGSHTITFVNSTGESIYLGIWGSPRGTAQGGYDPPTGWPEWKLDNGQTKTWSAPGNFNGRVFPRTGCVSGTCTGGDCGGTKCSVTAQPVSLVEFNLDDGNINWYDVSYVDGYNFPITVTTDRSCGMAGCETLPACPWTKRGDVCFSSCQEFTRQYPADYTTRDEFYKVCCKCKTPADKCGCGNQCGGLTACTDGYGCSIFTDYSSPLDTLAQAQCCCSPLRTDQENTKKKFNTCRAGGDWPTSYGGLNYQSYPRDIKDVCSNSYTWQYHDDEGLYTCHNDGSPVNFTITFHPRP
jgi:hypothetical protein